MRDEKMHAVVARSTSGSQNAERISVSERFWKWTPLWREAHFEVKMPKNHHIFVLCGRRDRILQPAKSEQNVKVL